VISIVASKCVDPGSKRVYTPTMVEKALAELTTKEGGGWHGVKENKSAKAQALEAIKALVAAQIIPIARARMRLRITGNKKCKEKVMQHVEQVETEEFLSGGDWECTGFVEPGKYKTLADIVGAETKGRGRVEILDTAVSVGVDWQILELELMTMIGCARGRQLNAHLMNQSLSIASTPCCHDVVNIVLGSAQFSSFATRPRLNERPKQSDGAVKSVAV
jgi:hypothetical protein